jgi:hypothetical protein
LNREPFSPRFFFRYRSDAYPDRHRLTPLEEAQFVFEEILGIPAHPLLIHAAVVFIPLQVLAALAYAFLPWARRHAGWFVFGITFVAPGAALLAKLSGDAFRARLVKEHKAGGSGLVAIDQHRSYGTMTLYFTLGLSVLLIIMMLLHRAATAQTPDKEGLVVGRGFTGLVVSVLTLIVAIGTGYYVFRTGDTGAHIVWSGY